jgi:hypothetical protein
MAGLARRGLGGQGRRALAQLLAACAACGALAFAGVAAAQEIQLTGPLASDDSPGSGTRYFRHLQEDVAARRDATVWISLGGTPAPEKVAAPFFGAGAEISNPVTTFGRLDGQPGELRWGPWGEAWVDTVGGRAEGGLFAQLYLFGHRRHGTLDLRFGAGYGEDSLGRTPHAAITIAAGPRYVEAVPWHETIRSDDGQPRTPQLVCGWRLFLSGRRTIEPEARFWVTGGLELELGFTARD